MTAEDLIRAARDSGISEVAIIATADIRFHEDFRKACERNACGKYGTSWMGPPAIGTIRELEQRASRYRRGLLLQTRHRLQGTFDLKGMLSAARAHQSQFRKFLDTVRSTHPGEPLLPLDAGCCSYCETCAYEDGEPCRHPDQALSSVEAYGMDVAALMRRAGLAYGTGKETLCFVGLLLFDLQDGPAA